jgi:hypothetical protein
MTPDKRLQEIADAAYRAAIEGKPKPPFYAPDSPAARAKLLHDHAQAAKAERSDD